MESPQDVTEIVMRYREAMRFVWNHCIWPDPELRDWDSVYAWRKLHLPLFEALVADPLGIAPGEMWGEQFRLVPRSQWWPTSVTTCPQSHGVWSPLNENFEAEDLELTPVGFFDWENLNRMDLTYFIARICGFRSDPGKVGHYAMVEVQYVNVMFEADR